METELWKMILCSKETPALKTQWTGPTCKEDYRDYIKMNESGGRRR